MMMLFMMMMMRMMKMKTMTNNDDPFLYQNKLGGLHLHH